VARRHQWLTGFDAFSTFFFLLLLTANVNSLLKIIGRGSLKAFGGVVDQW